VLRDQAVSARKLRKRPTQLLSREDDRQARRAFGVLDPIHIREFNLKHITVEE
jgi:hypothetical protein